MYSLPQNGVVLGVPPANAPDPNYPACSAKFFPDLAFPGLEKYESAADLTDPELAKRAFYLFLPTTKEARVYTTVIQADEAAKELGVSSTLITAYRGMLPVCNAIYSWCKESHNHPTPERTSSRTKKAHLRTTYDVKLQKEHVRQYQDKYGVAPPPPHVHRARERKRVVLLGPLDAAEAAAENIAAWERAGGWSPAPPSPEVATAAAVRAMKAADRGELLWDSPQYQDPLPAAKRPAPAADAAPNFQPDAPMAIKRRRFQPAQSILTKTTLPTSDHILPYNKESPSCYVLLPSPSDKNVASAGSSSNEAPAPAAPRGFFALSNGEIFETGAEAETRMKRDSLHVKIVSDLEAAPEDKAFKREAIRNNGKAVTPALKTWLQHYEAIPPDDVHERKRAALKARVAARKERNDRLLMLRARAIKTTARLWPPARCQPHHKENMDLAAAARREEERRKAAAHAAEREAAISASTYRAVLPQLYRSIQISHRITRLVNSLASNPDLPKLLSNASYPKVRSLEFLSPPDTPIDPTQWASVLPAMCNLRWLIVNNGIPFPLHILPSIAFRLIVFGSFSSLVGDWVALIASQKSIEELLFISDFYGAPPSPQQLPNLRVVRGRPADIARFSVQHRLEDLWFFRGPPFDRRTLKARDLTLLAASRSRLRTIRISAAQFLLLLAAAPKMLTTLQHIVLDEEVSWTDFVDHPGSRMEGSSLESFAAAADKRFPFLQSVLLACVQHHADPDRSRRLLSRADGPYFASIMTPFFSAPHLKTFRVLAIDGISTSMHWGSDRAVSYTEDSIIVYETSNGNAHLFHRVQIWTGTSFERVPRNKPGYDCALATPTDTNNFCVLHTDGMTTTDSESFKALVWPRPTVTERSSRPRPKKKPVASVLTDFEPAAEAAWQNTMDALAALPSQWAEGKLDNEQFELLPNASGVQSPLVTSYNMEDDSDMPPLQPSTEPSTEPPFESLCLTHELQEAELRQRDMAMEAAVAYIVAAMPEPDRRRWIEDGHRQAALEAREVMPGRRWVEEGHRQEALAGHSTCIMFHNPWLRRRGRGTVLRDDETWQDYSATSRALAYVD
ncbi:hypothetical protein C8R47DRAFT_1083818 [Mycena vitilis]|nr:hypothetical protein C8R47DRAFT_1083818 [Mycena vitilis]